MAKLLDYHGVKNQKIYRKNTFSINIFFSIKVGWAFIYNLSYEFTSLMFVSPDTRDAFNANEASLSLGMLSNQVVLVKVVTTSGELTQKVLW